MHRAFVLFASVLAFACLCCVAPGATAAGVPNGLVILRPTNDETVELFPGEYAFGEATAENHTGHEVALEFHPVSVMAVDDPGVMFDVDPYRMRGAARWVVLPSTTAKLPPGAQAKVSFSVFAPAHATPGAHPFGIGAELVGEDVDPPNPALFIGEVPGDVHIDLRAGPLQGIRFGLVRRQLDMSEPVVETRSGTHQFLLDLHNRGQRFVSAGGSMTLTRLLGDRRTYEFDETPLFPGSAAYMAPSEELELEPGTYVLEFQVTSDAPRVDATKLLIVE